MRLSPTDPVNPSIGKVAPLPPSMEEEALEMQYIEYMAAQGKPLVGFDEVEVLPGVMIRNSYFKDDHCPLPGLPYGGSLEMASYSEEEALEISAQEDLWDRENL